MRNLRLFASSILIILLLSSGSAWGALTAAIEVLPATTVEVGEEVYFSGSGTTYEDANLLGKARYEWDFGDGYKYEFGSTCPTDANWNVDAGGIAAVHYFMAPGTYTVTLSTKIWSTYTTTNHPNSITVTSTSSVTNGSGSKTFTVETGLALEAGMKGKMQSNGAIRFWMGGTITSYNSTTGELVLNVTCVAGAGTSATWSGSFEVLPAATDTATVEITVTGTAPLSGFEIQRANYNNRTKQYLYIQIPAAHRNTTTQLKLSLIGETAGTTVLLTKSSLAAEEIYLFDQSTLAADNYVMQAQLLDAEDNQITGGIWRDKFVKDYANTPTVGINENNSFVVGGTLVYPIGPFMSNLSTLTTYDTNASSNAAFTEGYAGSAYTSTSFGTYLDTMASLGMKMVGPGRGNYAITYAPQAANSWKRNHSPDTIASYVSTLKDKSALLAWGWQDEVNLGGSFEKIHPPTIAAWAYQVKANDLQHPSYNIFVGSDWSRYYGTSVQIFDYLYSHNFMGGKKWIQDIIGYDTYPITQQLYPIQNFTGVDTTKMGTYAIAFDSVDRFIENNKNLAPFISIVQPCKGLTPIVISEDQVYMESWLYAIHGAKGQEWFIFFDMANTGRWTSMKKFSDQMATLAPVVLQPVPSRTVTDTACTTNRPSTAAEFQGCAQNRVDTMIREYGEYIYVFAARMTEPVPARSYVSVTLTGTPGTVVSGGVITGDAHLWDVATATIGTGGTVTAIATCQDYGYITTAANTLTTISSGVSGWTAVTNTQLATGGSRYYDYTEPETLEGVSFTVSGLTGEGTVEVVDESRSLVITDGVFTDDFAKNAVHIYKISNNTPTTYTVTVTKAGAGTGTVTSSPSGVSCGSDCSEAYVAGNTIVLTATPDTGMTFGGWSGDYGCTGTGTCTVSSIAANAAVTATFSVTETPPTYYMMTVSYTGTGSGVTSPAAGEYSKGGGTEVSISATADTNSTFNAWSGTCGCTGSTSPCTIAEFPGNDCTVIAEFAADTKYTVTITVGSGASSVTGDNGCECSSSLSPCSCNAFADTTITFSAIPSVLSSHCTWTGCTANSCSMTEDKNLSVSCAGNTVFDSGAAMGIGVSGGAAATIY